MIAGRYTLEREIGRGGAGVVHLGHDEVLDRHVAIKRMGLLPGTTEDDVARAEREARLAAGISHPHVVSILDLVKDEDCYWLVMEHVEGRTLTEVWWPRGRWSPPAPPRSSPRPPTPSSRPTRAGIVHRDVKPSNIMVDDHDHAKLGDFGIARSANDAALTRTGLVTGSPAYLAPEVASGSVATAASDVWSLGAHAVPRGRRPGAVRHGPERARRASTGSSTTTRRACPDDHPLAALLAGMMQKDPDERWPVERVRDELRRVARGDRRPPRPRSARPDSEATLTLGAVPPGTCGSRPAPPTATAVSSPAPASAPPRRRRAPARADR